MSDSNELENSVHIAANQVREYNDCSGLARENDPLFSFVIGDATDLFKAGRNITLVDL